MPVLYQKYRPQNFRQIVGQKFIVQTLKNSAQQNKLAHGYLLVGSRGVGKTSIARILAKAANCPNLQEGDPCAKCNSCVSISEGNFLDVIEIDAASNTGVDNVRELIDRLSALPVYGKKKVFIVDEVHMLSKAAFNALLKTLEEPPEHVMFILATTDSGKVPETIVSRTQRFDLKKLNLDELEKSLKTISDLEAFDLSNEVIELIAKSARGGFRDALSNLGIASSLSNPSAQQLSEILGLVSEADLAEIMQLIKSGNTKSAVENTQKILATSIDPLDFHKEAVEFLRQIILHQALNTEDKNSSEHISSIAKLFALAQSIYLIRVFLKSFKETQGSPVANAPIIMAIIEASEYFKKLSSPNPTQGTDKLKATPVHSSPSLKLDSGVISSGQPQKIETESSPDLKLEKSDKSLQANSDERRALENIITENEARAFWPQIIESIKKVNNPLATLLKNSPILNADSGNIQIAVKFLFHKEYVESLKNSAIISAAIFECSQKKGKVKGVISKSSDQEAKPAIEAISDAIKIFGGELVE